MSSNSEITKYSLGYRSWVLEGSYSAVAFLTRYFSIVFQLALMFGTQPGYLLLAYYVFLLLRFDTLSSSIFKELINIK